MAEYYTPTIEEFHVGFEYEIKSYKDFEQGTDNWNKEIVNTDPLHERSLASIQYSINKTCVRIKYLDKEDIESLEFTKTFKNQWIDWEDYHLDRLPGNYGYFLHATLHFPRMYVKSNRFEDNQFQIIVHRHFISEEDCTTSIDKQLNDNESEVVYKGIIKNKQELKKLMQQLNII